MCVCAGTVTDARIIKTPDGPPCLAPQKCMRRSQFSKDSDEKFPTKCKKETCDAVLRRTLSPVRLRRVQDAGTCPTTRRTLPFLMRGRSRCCASACIISELCQVHCSKRSAPCGDGDWRRDGDPRCRLSAPRDVCRPRRMQLAATTT